MKTDPLTTSHEELFRKKALRRRQLAVMPIEDKLKRLVILQRIAYEIGKQTGRECRTPWGYVIPNRR